MDIIQLACIPAEPAVQEILQGLKRQLRPRGDQQAAFSVAAQPGDFGAAFAAVPICPLRECLRRVPDQQVCITALDDPVDRFKHLNRVVDVVQLTEGITRRRSRPIGPGMPGFLFFKAGFRRRERVIPVADGVEKLLLRVLFLLARLIGRDAPVKLPLLVTRDQPALHMAPAQHEVKGVKPGQVRLPLPYRLDQLPPVVVAQQQHVRQLQGGAAAHGHPGRDALGNGALGCAHGGVHRPAIVIAFQVQLPDQAAPQRAAVQAPFGIDIAVRKAPENPVVQIAQHILVYRADPPLGVSVQLRLRQDEVHGRRHPCCDLLRPAPVVRLGGELVTGYDCPALQITSVGDENFCSAEAGVYRFFRLCHQS